MTQSLLISLIFVSTSAFFSWLITKYFLQHAPSLGLVDVPNERSSHTQITLRGGGIGFVVTISMVSLALILTNQLETYFSLALPIGGCLVAYIGWTDDRFQLSAKKRLFTHLFAAFLVAWSLFDFTPLTQLFLLLATTFYIAWMINLYNFMDGTDGIAGVEAFTASLWLGLHAQLADSSALSILFWCITTSSFAFLYFNFPPAKVFMGDVGSGFLGFFFGAITIYAAFKKIIPFESSLILLALFIVDTSYTLIVRLYHREKVTQAHRNHAYQHAVQKGWSHSQVAYFTFFTNIFWLGPLSLGPVFYPLQFPVYLLIAVIPLLAWQVYQRAGETLNV